MPKNELISVVVPVYNGEIYIKDCLQNLLGQTYQAVEIIVVDDGSTDNTSTIAREFPIKLISLECNKGLSAARNAGLNATSGRYVHFMDVDDSINSDFYEKMYLAITANNADVACSEMVNEARPQKAQRFKEQRVFDTLRGRLEATYVGKIGYVWRYLFHVDFLKANSLSFHEGRLMEDLMFSLSSLYFAKSLVVVPGAIYFYHHQENSIMTNKCKVHAQKRRADREYAKQMMHEFAAKYNFEIPGVTTGRLRYVLKKWIG